MFKRNKANIRFFHFIQSINVVITCCFLQTAHAEFDSNADKFFISKQVYVQNEDRLGVTQIAGDFNCDGIDDLVLAEPGITAPNGKRGGMIRLILGNSDPNWSNPEEYLISQESPGVIGVAEYEDRFGASLTKGDFNNDGCLDLVVGSPYEDIGNDKVEAGMIHVFYGPVISNGNVGSSVGIHQDTNGVPGVGEDGDRFGETLAAGDLNGDGYDDLAVGIPDKDILYNGKKVKDAGEIIIIYGSNQGLNTNWSYLINQGKNGINGIPEEKDRFGFTLHIDHLNDDPYKELIVGVPYEDIGSISDAGMVSIIFGRSTHLGNSTMSNKSIIQGQNGYISQESALDFNPNIQERILSKPEEKDLFGWAIATGYFDTKPTTVGKDLVISAPGESIIIEYDPGYTTYDEEGNPIPPGIESYYETGVVYIFIGNESATGYHPKRQYPMHQYNRKVLQGNTAKGHDFFGLTLAVGNFDNNDRCKAPWNEFQCDDLAVGSYLDSRDSDLVYPEDEFGVVEYFYNSEREQTYSSCKFSASCAADDTKSAGHVLFESDSYMAGFAQDLHLGRSISVGDFNNDGKQDLSIGMPLIAQPGEYELNDPGYILIELNDK